MITAIPIPQRHSFLDEHKCKGSHSTTPSLQSILEQKKCSHSQCTRLSVSSHSTNSSSTSVPSLASIPSSLESCETHPLESFNVMQDIDQDFFTFDRNNRYFELMVPIHSTPTLSQEESLPQEQTFSLKAIINKSRFVSNLSESIKSFTSSTMQQNNVMLFGIQPRLTDDKLPQAALKKIHSQETEMETFKITTSDNYLSTDLTSSASTMSIIRNREARINSQFLRLYAYESSSRVKGLLPEISHEEETQMLIEQQGRQPVITNEREFALLVRQRLWQCVVLPPRDDSVTALDATSEYVYIGDGHWDVQGDDVQGDAQKSNVSLIRKLGDVKPWINLDDNINPSSRTILKPRGVIQKNVQFTVKGWCNSRWQSHTVND